MSGSWFLCHDRTTLAAWATGSETARLPKMAATMKINLAMASCLKNFFIKRP